MCFALVASIVEGTQSDPATWFGHIVPGTGTGGFAGWAGSARIVHDDPGGYFEIDVAGAAGEVAAAEGRIPPQRIRSSAHLFGWGVAVGRT
jgi:hypothetical protein